MFHLVRSAFEAGGAATSPAADDAGNVYVTGSFSDNAFRIHAEEIFADGFESGDTSAWSAAVP